MQQPCRSKFSIESDKHMDTRRDNNKQYNYIKALGFRYKLQYKAHTKKTPAQERRHMRISYPDLESNQNTSSIKSVSAKIHFTVFYLFIRSS